MGCYYPKKRDQIMKSHLNAIRTGLHLHIGVTETFLILQVLLCGFISIWIYHFILFWENYRPNQLLPDNLSLVWILISDLLYRCHSVLEKKDVRLLLLAVFILVECVSATVDQIINTSWVVKQNASCILNEYHFIAFANCCWNLS